jgi:peptidoglycan/xylan/chitin deacetylase (PgdA/CDA1 family)
MMALRSRIGEARRMLLCSLHSRAVPLGNEGPVVSFSFDDFPRTAYTVGGAILKNFGARGTYYTAMGLMNTQNQLGDQFGPRDLDSLLADGHELACHTFSHISCRTVPLQVFENDLRRGRTMIRQMTGCDPVNFAYPFGHVTLTAKKRVGKQMRSCRGIYGGLNGPMVDLNLLRANSLYGDVDRFMESETLLSNNERRKSWLIFYTHDVRSSPSPFGCTPALLEKTLSRTVQRGFRIVPIEEMISCVQAVSSESIRACPDCVRES